MKFTTCVAVTDFGCYYLPTVVWLPQSPLKSLWNISLIKEIMLPIGFPTYCLVVTMTLNVSRITELMDQWSRNTDESMWTCETLTKVFSLKNMSSMTQTTWRSHEVYFLLRPKLQPTFKFFDVRYLMLFYVYLSNLNIPVCFWRKWQCL